jgi:hypothetical protein
VPVGSLAIAGLAPSIPIPVPKGSLAITRYAPTLSLAFSTTVPTGTLAITGHAPDPDINLAVDVPVGALLITGHAPSIQYLVVAPFDIRYALREDFTFDIVYGIAGETLQTFAIQYDLVEDAQVEASHGIVYSLPLEATHELRYGLASVVEQEHDMLYSMTEAVEKTIVLQYDILPYTPVAKSHKIWYRVLGSSVIDISGEVKVII